MKQKSFPYSHLESGFTVVELLVVLAMMTLIMGAVILNFNLQRAARAVTFAQNETVTNIRKVQSYMLSSRNIAAGVPAKFYFIKFVRSQNTYTIGAIDKDFISYPHDSNPSTPAIETVTYPGDVTLSSMLFGVETNNSDQCMEILFSAPYGKMFLNRDPNCTVDIAAVAKNPTALYALNDQYVQLTLRSSDLLTTKTINIYSLSGRIDAN